MPTANSYNNLYDYLIIVGVYFAFYFCTKDLEIIEENL